MATILSISFLLPETTHEHVALGGVRLVEVNECGTQGTGQKPVETGENGWNCRTSSFQEFARLLLLTTLLIPAFRLEQASTTREATECFVVLFVVVGWNVQRSNDDDDDDKRGECDEENFALALSCGGLAHWA